MYKVAKKAEKHAILLKKEALQKAKELEAKAEEELKIARNAINEQSRLRKMKEQEELDAMFERVTNLENERSDIMKNLKITENKVLNAQ